MITNFGKNIISKYLLGQIDSYANYIAIGTGGSTAVVTQQSLNFEAARYPVISKGVSLDSSNNRQLVFTAQIDSLDRFDITEIGLYPAAYDSLLSNSVGSKILLDFSINELWNYNDASTYNLPLTFISNPLDYGNTTNVLDAQADGATTLKSYSFDSNNSFFTATRIARYEKPRMYDSAIIVTGDMSTTYNTGKYIELTGFGNVSDLDNASDSVDELRIAFNVINTTALTSAPSGGVQFTIRFMTNDGQTYREYVFDTASSLNTKTTWIKSLQTSSRYVVGKQTLDDGTSSGDFRWSAVNAVRIYAKATDSTSIANYAIIFDALRFENNSTTNPLYGLIGYSVPASNIIKASDTSGLIEFRFNLGVA